MAKQTRQTDTNKTSPAGDGKADYRVTDRAPGRINGRAAEVGATLRLSEAEARGELLAGHLVSVPASKPE